MGHQSRPGGLGLKKLTGIRNEGHEQKGTKKKSKDLARLRIDKMTFKDHYF